MRRRRLLIPAIVVGVLLVGGFAARPYMRAASFVARAANLGGRLEALANRRARAITVEPATTVPTRHGSVPGRLYRPHGRIRRTALLVPGIHSMGIDEPRLTALAEDLAGSGVAVMTVALPDLQRYEITPLGTDTIEDAVGWLSRKPDLAPDGRVGLIGISFAGGLSIVAAGRPSIRDRVAYGVSFGGHGDLGRVLSYLLTGKAPHVEGLEARPPHDYGVAVILYGSAPHLVPAEQVGPLREGVAAFLYASQLTLVDRRQADDTFQRAREIAKRLPEPSATFLNHVNDRDVETLGPALIPHLGKISDDRSLSPEKAPSLPAAPVYLLHGTGDTVIPTVETVLLERHLRSREVDVTALLSRTITHAEVDSSAAITETLKLVRFWASILSE